MDIDGQHLQFTDHFPMKTSIYSTFTVPVELRLIPGEYPGLELAGMRTLLAVLHLLAASRAEELANWFADATNHVAS
jgi:hypothetical protein